MTMKPCGAPRRCCCAPPVSKRAKRLAAKQALAQVDSLRGRLDVLIVDYNLGQSMTGTEVAEEFARLLGHAVPTVILTGDPANAEVPWLADAPVWLARKPLRPKPVSRAAAAGGVPARRRG